MTAVLPIAASLPIAGDTQSVAGTPTGSSIFDAAASAFNLSVNPGHHANLSVLSGDAIGAALKNYAGRVHRHEAAQSSFSQRSAAAIDAKESSSAPHRGPAYASLEPPQGETTQSGRDTVTLDMLRAAESASLEAMNFMFDTSLVVGSMTEANRSFNTLLKAQ
jgi:hypothetical protein